MSKEKAANKAKPNKVSPPVQKYKKDEIIASASSFGVLPEVMAGALSIVISDELSRSEIEDAINKFKNRKVK